ncbi:uncharacterized protein LOC143029265 isoform X1 [Oratosquilla oratoria]|uniref:uncharacterized protein LOC143029265 isoform X1 n=1 Tax=Oratosquilla oratoria TaxID=337810 RepID=UPI003F7756EB
MQFIKSGRGSEFGSAFASKRDPLILCRGKSRQLTREESESYGALSSPEARKINGPSKFASVIEETEERDIKEEPLTLDSISSQLSTSSYSEQDKGFVVGDLIKCSEGNRNSGFAFFPRSYINHMGSEGGLETYLSNGCEEARIQKFKSISGCNTDRLEEEPHPCCPSNLCTTSEASGDGSMLQPILNKDEQKNVFSEPREHCKRVGSPDLFLFDSEESQNGDRERFDKVKVGSHLAESSRPKAHGGGDINQGMSIRNENEHENHDSNGRSVSSELEMQNCCEGKFSRHQEKARHLAGIDMERNSSKGNDADNMHGEPLYQDSCNGTLSKSENFPEHNFPTDDLFTSDLDSLHCPSAINRGNPFQNASRGCNPFQSASKIDPFHKFSKGNPFQSASKISPFQCASEVNPFQKASKETNPFRSSCQPTSEYSFDCGTVSQLNSIYTSENSSQLAPATDNLFKNANEGNAFPRASQEPDIFTAASQESFLEFSRSQDSQYPLNKDQEMHDYLDDLQQTLGPPCVLDEVDGKSTSSCGKRNLVPGNIKENGIDKKNSKDGAEKKAPAFKPVFGKSKIVKPSLKPQSAKSLSTKPGVKATSKPVSVQPSPSSVESVKPLPSSPWGIELQDGIPREESGKKEVMQNYDIPEKQSEDVVTPNKALGKEGVNGKSGDENSSHIPKEKKCAPIKPAFAKMCTAKEDQVLKVLKSPVKKPQFSSVGKGKKSIAEADGMSKKSTKKSEHVGKENLGQANSKANKKATKMKNKGPMVNGDKKQQPSESRKNVLQNQKHEGRKKNKETKTLNHKPDSNIEGNGESAHQESINDDKKNKSKPLLKHPKKSMDNNLKKYGKHENKVDGKQVLDSNENSMPENENDKIDENSHKSLSENDSEIGMEKMDKSNDPETSIENSSPTKEHQSCGEKINFESKSKNKSGPASPENMNENVGMLNGQEESTDKGNENLPNDEMMERDGKCPEQNDESSGSPSLVSQERITMLKAPMEIFNKEKHLGIKKKSNCSSKVCNLF